MKKRNLIVIIIALVLVVGILTTILILKGSIWQKEKITDELKQAQATFDIRLNSDSTEYYIYRLKPSANTDGATITIPDSVDGIPVTKLIDRDLGFSSYNNITKIIIGKNISYIGTNTTVISDDTKELGDDFFSLATSLITIEVSVENKNFSSNNGILYNKNQTILLRYPAGRTMSNNQSSHRFVIPNTVILIYKKAFSLNKTLEMVTFGENVEAVDDEAFSGCENLVSVNFDNSNIKSIGTKAFERCLNLSSVVLPIELERLGSSAFMGCSNLKSIYTNSEFVDRLKEIFAQNNEKFIDKIQQISSN